MLIRLKLTSKITIAPRTISQLSRIGMKPNNVCFRLKWNDNRSTTNTKSMDNHWSTLKSSFICNRVSVV